MGITFFTMILELIGSAAFAISGVIVAKEKKMDIFGAVILGCITAVGGGAIRDLILGIHPQSMFKDPKYVLCAFIASLITFIIEYFGNSKLEEHKTMSEVLLNVTDTIGLAIFAIMGTKAAMDLGYSSNHFLCVFVGALTGIGGGILRDMLAGEMPLILRERVYGVAAIIGSCIYVYASMYIARIDAMLISFVITVLIRFLAIHYKWNLPRLK